MLVLCLSRYLAVKLRDLKEDVHGSGAVFSRLRRLRTFEPSHKEFDVRKTPAKHDLILEKRGDREMGV